MRDLKISSGLLLLIVAAFGNVSAIYDMKETCEYMSFGFIADPSSCQGYGYCNNSMLIGTHKCPNGYLYNSRQGICDMPENVQCVSDIKNVCSNVPDMTFVADPTNCNGYCYCNNRIAQCTTCPEAQFFDSKKKQCVYAGSNPTCTGDSICRLVPNGVFMGDPKKCGKYIGCLEGMGTPGECQGSFYNYKIGMCQSSNPCINSSPGDVGKGVLENLGNKPEICKSYKAGGAATQFFSDAQTCMGYYICTSATGPGVWAKCQKGTHFNGEKCVTPYTFKCAFDRCGNLNRPFVSAIGNGCKNYLVCRNQTSQPFSTDYTGTACGNGFFNEYTGTCDTVSPKSTEYVLC